MKVSELIALLQKAPQDAELQSDGCDCYGDVARVFLTDEGKVMLARSDGACLQYEQPGAAPRGYIEVK
jgi:hypothetical protein